MGPPAPKVLGPKHISNPDLAPFVFFIMCDTGQCQCPGCGAAPRPHNGKQQRQFALLNDICLEEHTWEPKLPHKKQVWVQTAKYFGTASAYRARDARLSNARRGDGPAARGGRVVNEGLPGTRVQIRTRIRVCGALLGCSKA